MFLRGAGYPNAHYVKILMKATIKTNIENNKKQYQVLFEKTVKTLLFYLKSVTLLALSQSHQSERIYVNFRSMLCICHL